MTASAGMGSQSTGYILISPAPVQVRFSGGIDAPTYAGGLDVPTVSGGVD